MGSVVIVAAGDAAVRKGLLEGLAAQGVAARGDGCDSGRSLVAACARGLREGHSLVAVVLDNKLAIGGGKSSAIAVRAVERAFGAARTGFVFHMAAERDASLDRILDWLGQAAYRRRSDDDAAGDDAIAELTAAIGEVRGS